MDKKEIKQLIKTEIVPYLIGLRNDLAENTQKKLIEENEVAGVLLKGKKGDDGKTPIADVDYPSIKTIEEYIKNNLPTKGKEYFTREDIKSIVSDVYALMPSKAELKGDKGDTQKVDYSVVASLAEPLIDIKHKEIQKEIKKLEKALLFDIETKINASGLTAEQIVQKLQTVKGRWLNADNIRGLEKYMQTFISTSTGGGGGSSSSGISDAPSDGSTYGRKNGAWDVIIGGAQTPWTSDIDGANYNLDNVNIVESKQLDLESYPCLQGTAESQVQLPNTGSRFNFGANDFTITFWRYSDIKTASTGNGAYLAVNYPQTYDGSHGYAPIMLGGSGVGNDRLYVTTNGTATAFVKDIPIKYDEWQFIVITRNGNTWEIWVDNVLKVTWSSSITIWSNGTNGTNVLSSWYTNFMNKGFFIKELNFYNVGFLPADVAYYDNSGKGRFGTSADTGLVGGFHFNNSLVDYKGVGNGSWVGNAFYSNSNFVLEGDTTTPTINTVKILDSQFLLNKGINAKYGYFEDMGGTSPYAVKGVSSNTTAVIGQLGYYDGTINYGVHAEIGSSNNIAGRFYKDSYTWVNLGDNYNTGSPFAINAYGKSYFTEGTNTVTLTDGSYSLKTKGSAYFESLSSGNIVQLGLESQSAIVAFKGTGGYSALEVGDGTHYTYFHTGTYSIDSTGTSFFSTLYSGGQAILAQAFLAGEFNTNGGNNMSVKICDNSSGGVSNNMALYVYGDSGIGSNSVAYFEDANSSFTGNTVKIFDGTYAIKAIGNINITGASTLVPQSSAPSSPEEGQMYVDNNSGNHLYIYLNSSWTLVI